MAVQQFLMMGRPTAGRTVLIGQRWGALHNNSGELGLGNTSETTVMTRLGSETYWTNKETTGNGDNRLVVNSEGKLYAWGHNDSGVLGLGDTTTRNSPVQVGSDTDWNVAGCTSGGASAIKTNGTLWTWGENSTGALGKGNTTNTSSPSQVGSDTDWVSIIHTSANTNTLFAMNDSGEVYYAGTGLGGLGNVSSFTQIGGADGFTDVVLVGKSLVGFK